LSVTVIKICTSLHYSKFYLQTSILSSSKLHPAPLWCVLFGVYWETDWSTCIYATNDVWICTHQSNFFLSLCVFLITVRFFLRVV